MDRACGSAPMHDNNTSRDEMFDDRVSAALGSLPEIARQCLLMRTLFGAPYSEIAARFEIPEGTAMSHVHRARRSMRTRLERDSTGGSERAREAAPR
jgi:RNA polymerase sigma factor (sigma-70 family)